MRDGIDMWLTLIQVVPNYECYAPSVSKQRSFAFFRFIVFDMYLDIIYVQVHIKIYESTKVKNDLHFKTEGVLLKVSKFIQKPPPQLQQDGASPKLEYWSLRFLCLPCYVSFASFGLHRSLSCGGYFVAPFFVGVYFAAILLWRMLCHRGLSVGWVLFHP